MNLITIFFSSSILSLLLIYTHSSSPPPCIHSCGAGDNVLPVPYPFGFSSGCPIQLNCISNTTPAVDEFPIQSFTDDSIIINIPTLCQRPLQSILRLFKANIAPTIENVVFLLNCSKSINNCFLPTTMVQTHFESSNCGSNTDSSNKISCYSEMGSNRSFMNLNNLKNIDCGFLFSSISAELLGNVQTSGISLGVQLFQLGWWLNGDCDCSSNGNCTKIVSPIDGKLGHRCSCLDGFVGDGYEGGLGCRTGLFGCTLIRYITGQCTGVARVVVLVGGIIVGACLMITAGLICCYIQKVNEIQKRNKTSQRLSKATGILIPIYPYKDIEKATNYFSEKQRLGTGAFATVYAGKLNEEWVAIKRLKYRDTNTTDQVLNEIKLISSVSHPNLVKLMGCSIDKGGQFLVYEYMPNGTLSEHLHKERRNDVLPWLVRLDIAVDTALAIAHLHSSTDPPIFHRDIKSSNILLDFNFKCKVADFGLSRVGIVETSHISTSPQGTPGYLDPQYHQNYQLSDKSDVYSFGVLMVEMITGLKAVDFSRPAEEINLAVFAMDRIGKGELEKIIDPSIDQVWDKGILLSIHRSAELAFRCLTFNRDMRPSMTEVAVELERIRQTRLDDKSAVLLSERKLKVNVTELSNAIEEIKEFSQSPTTIISARVSGPSDHGSSSSSSTASGFTNFEGGLLSI
ncbi:wall-associated receptor kinase-like 14 [Impatiens glandulifera]|uniref:wall-associated receptor kinase-like 14 n=1 Tax=Impatiens glandulifera TaxID=253017 RepID=UPI001FB1250C|nr:wall-associated receptor kinase-like 14 [Impatiens glandulifera]